MIAGEDDKFDVYKADLYAMDEEIDMAVLKLEEGKY